MHEAALHEVPAIARDGRVHQAGFTLDLVIAGATETLDDGDDLRVDRTERTVPEGFP